MNYPTEKPEMEVDWKENWFMNADDLSKLLKPEMTVIEVGSWVGRSTMFFAHKCKRVYAIDTWLGSPEEHIEDYKTCLNLYDQFIVNTWNMQHRINPIRSWSSVGLQYLLDIEVKPDLIYIDGSHQYNDVFNDLVLSNKFDNAIICGDDYGWGNERPITRAVNEFVNAFDYKLRVERDWFYEIVR